MKNYSIFFVKPSLLLIFTFFISTSCDDKVELTRTYSVYEPVYMSPTAIRASFEIGDPVVLNEPGKIYMYGDYLFVNEPGKGIHVINNQDKTNPINMSFINLPGNFDIAASNGFLYADSYMDLVALNISDINNIKIENRLEDIFLNILTTGMYDSEKGVVTDWMEVDKIEVSSNDFNGTFPGYFEYGLHQFAASDRASLTNSFSSPQSPSGVGGSMARFTIAEHFLYTIDQSSLYVFNIQNPENPTAGPTVNVGWGIETLFPYQGKLFIGAQNGMYIYGLENPLAPQQISMFSHIVSCDPVVVNDTLAYVTLRGGSECRGGFSNQLDILNVKRPEAPELLVTHAMTSPYGLGYDNGLLFICEGENGLKVFDVTDIYDMSNRLLEHYTEIDAYDVIPFQNVLMLIGRDGLYQFDYSDPAELIMLSHLPIERTNPLP